KGRIISQITRSGRLRSTSSKISSDNCNGIADINLDFGFIKNLLAGVKYGMFRGRRTESWTTSKAHCLQSRLGKTIKMELENSRNILESEPL
ncbi:MAG: hypothetical protein OEX77_12360, partial [Candidatus Bathyarchaeota archaeon]|nr:hypothetical protein [Candidatus Bathyarchaeota archaeon]